MQYKNLVMMVDNACLRQVTEQLGFGVSESSVSSEFFKFRSKVFGPLRLTLIFDGFMPLENKPI